MLEASRAVVEVSGGMGPPRAGDGHAGEAARRVVAAEGGRGGEEEGQQERWKRFDQGWSGEERRRWRRNPVGSGIIEG